MYFNRYHNTLTLELVQLSRLGWFKIYFSSIQKGIWNYQQSYIINHYWSIRSVV